MIVRVIKCQPFFVAKSVGFGPRRSMRRPRKLGTKTRHCSLVRECSVLQRKPWQVSRLIRSSHIQRCHFFFSERVGPRTIFLKASRVSSCSKRSREIILGTIRIYDGDSEDDAQEKVRFYFSSEFLFIEIYSVCLSVLKHEPAKDATNALSSKQKYEKLAVVVHVLQTMHNWLFHVVVLQRTGKKCTKNYNARTQLLFCLLNLFVS